MPYFNKDLPEGPPPRTGPGENGTVAGKVGGTGAAGTGGGGDDAGGTTGLAAGLRGANDIPIIDVDPPFVTNCAQQFFLGAARNCKLEYEDALAKAETPAKTTQARNAYITCTKEAIQDARDVCGDNP